MMVTDPRLVVRRLLDPSAAECQLNTAVLLYEDGTTQARVEADYELIPATLDRLTSEAAIRLDGVYVVGNPRVEPPDDYGSGPVCYNYVLTIQAVAVTKYAADKTMVVNGAKLERAMMEEARRIIREHPYGSLRTVQSTHREVARLGLTVVYGDTLEILYKQYATPYGTATGMTYQRYPLRLIELRIGEASDDYNSCGEMCLGPCDWTKGQDTVTELVIPGAATNVLQLVNTGRKGEGFIDFVDWDAARMLLYNTDVAGAGEVAVMGSGVRNVIGYMVLKMALISITIATDARSTPTATYVFTNAVVRDVTYHGTPPNSLIRMRFYYDYVTETIA